MLDTLLEYGSCMSHAFLSAVVAQSLDTAWEQRLHEPMFYPFIFAFNAIPVYLGILFSVPRLFWAKIFSTGFPSLASD